TAGTRGAAAGTGRLRARHSGGATRGEGVVAGARTGRTGTARTGSTLTRGAGRTVAATATVALAAVALA
ncbi:hypothetical protein, partial [Streptomyces sp. SID1034]|uniref:hypothetical protein n=1 Tax=Streptomyces sp. SID1034 TaxID=2690248 RepID=UPI0023518D60